MRSPIQCLVISLLCAPALAAPAKPAPAASVPGAQNRAGKVTSSPVVRASEDAQMPGEVRPENRVVPQITVPLRRDKSGAASSPSQSGSAPQIDERAARKAARREK